MKITNVIQADDGNWNCNVTSKHSNDEYDIGKKIHHIFRGGEAGCVRCVKCTGCARCTGCTGHAFAHCMF